MTTYDPNSLGIKAPSGGFQQGGWYSGRQFWNGTLSEPGQIHEQSNQQGAGQLVSAEVNAQSAAAQGQTPQQLESYLQAQRATQPKATPATVPGGLTPGMSVGGAGSISMGAVQTPTLNLPELYRDFYDKSGVSQLEQQLADLERSKTETIGKTNDNPYLSEATRSGRVAKIESLHAERTKNLRDEIATKRADIETKLNLATKQFDINSQAAQQAFNQFNTLLSMGALDNASGETIAQITKSTGISSDMIYSAINANKAKNVKTEMIKSEDDNGNVTISIINPDTGELIKQTSLGSVGTKTKVSGGGSTQNSTTDFLANASTVQPQQTEQGDVGIFPQLVAQYAPYMTLQKIYDLYLQSEPGKMYEKPVEDAKEIQQLYNYYRGK